MRRSLCSITHALVIQGALNGKPAPTFPTFGSLRKHIESVYKQHFCDICLVGRKVSFIADRYFQSVLALLSQFCWCWCLLFVALNTATVNAVPNPGIGVSKLIGVSTTCLACPFHESLLDDGCNSSKKTRIEQEANKVMCATWWAHAPHVSTCQ